MSLTLIVITGPTGVGKTELTLRVAEHYQVPVINADSRQIYREIPIGTAAPTREQQARVCHYFVGSRSVSDDYSASMYEQDVLRLLADMETQGQEVALLSGGSMLYVDAVCKGIDDIPTVRDDIRSLLKRRLATEGLPPLVEELRQLDPVHWEKVDRRNPRRVVHALEICIQTGRPYSSFLSEGSRTRPFRVVKIGLNVDRALLYERINQRTEQMLADGFSEEALRMIPYRHLNALNTVGYKEMFDYLDGLVTMEQTIDRIQSNTRRYARKQLTWYKRDEEMRWFDPVEVGPMIAYIDERIEAGRKPLRPL